MEPEIASMESLFPDLEEQALRAMLCNSNESQTLNSSACGATWDGVLCWPPTASGTSASLPCFAELNGVMYDVSANATKECYKNATWSKWSNYRSCKPIDIPEDEYLKVLWDLKDAVTVYYVGYGISLVALSLALWIFLSFKELRCVRNTIHAHLMVTYFMLDVTWILTAKLQSSQNGDANKVACYLTILLTYLMGTNFFWMFVEGLYLFVLVVKTFSVDNIKMRTYVTLGWGLPAIVATTWAAVKGSFSNLDEDSLAPTGCPWQKRDYYDYIFIGPVISVLLVNIFFLARIMWVLITKLRATNTVESQQYRKAAKALLVLIPLLGVTYLLVIATPPHRTGEVVFTFLQAALLSIQGFTVAVLYCFLNGEVQNSLKTRLERWKVRQALGRGQHHSPGDKFCRGRDIRESCVSFATSASYVTIPPSSIRSPPTSRVDCPSATSEERTPINDDSHS